MSSGLGYPDWQKIQQWIGAPLDQATGAAIGAGAINLGAYNLASWASIVIAVKPTGGRVTVTVKQKLNGGPATLELDEQIVVAAGATAFEAFVLFGDVVSVTLQGDTVGETVDYAIYPSNTTTNAQVITSATINIQHNEALIAAEPTVDFVDAGANVWTVADDASNTRVKVTPPRVLTGLINNDGTIFSGSGFTSSHLGTGRYKITFTTPYAAVPATLAIPSASSNNEDLTMSSPAVGSVQININDGGVAVDRAFAFFVFPIA